MAASSILSGGFFTRRWVKTAAAIRTAIIKPLKIAARGRLIPTRSRIAPVTFRIARKSRSQFGSLYCLKSSATLEWRTPQTKKIEAATNACRKIATLCMAEGYAAGARLGKEKSQSKPILGVSGCARYNCRMKFCALVLTAIFCAASLFAEETPESIAQSELPPSLLTIYKDVHQYPELSTHEQRTSELIAKELKAATARLCSCAPPWMRCRSRRKPACCGLASASTEFNDIPKGAPSSPVARNSATAYLLVE